MPKTTKTAIQVLNEKIIASLEKGVNPWAKPWMTGQRPAFNINTGKTYSLLNQLALSKPGAYATFKQWSDMGGRIRKGAKAEVICFWSIYTTKPDKDDPDAKEKTIPVLKKYNVFNIDDVTFPDTPPKKVQDYLTQVAEAVPSFTHERHEKAEQILTAYLEREGIRFEEKDLDRAFYSPANDLVQIPPLDHFPLLEEYYSTKAHELVHSTGHPSRLNRDLKGGFGSDQYSREELIAEMGAAYFMALLGLETPESFNNSAAYIQGWKKFIEQDQKAIVVAAGRAQKAIEFILGKSVDEFEGA